MSKLTIGRVGLDNIELDGVTGWRHDGDQLSIRVEVYSTLAEALTIRQQILGYVDSPDEAFVPVTWSEEPEADGYYVVESASVTPDTDGRDVFTLDVRLTRVLGYSAPLLELMSAGARRASSHLTGSQGAHLYAVPEASRSIAVYNLTTGTYGAAVGGFVREGATGDVRDIGATVNPEQPRLVQFYLTPDEHYQGAATLYVGDGLNPAVGRQIRNAPTVWRLSNGLIEVEPVASAQFDLRVRMWLSATSVWSPWVSFSLVGNNPRVPMVVPHSITVLRNGPEEVAIRLLSRRPSTTGYAPVSVDFSLNRGARYVAVELQSTAPSLYGFRCAAFAGATFVTADEDRVWKLIGDVHMVMMAPYVIAQSSNDVHPNEGGVTSVKAWSFGFGMVEAALSATADDHQETAAEYFFASAARQSVVAQ